MARRELSELMPDDAEPGPLHERDDDVDPVGGGDLAAELVSEPEVARAVHDEVAVAERERGADQLAGAEAIVRGAAEREEDLGRVRDALVGADAGVGGAGRDQIDDLVREGELVLDALVGGEAAECADEGVVEEAGEEVWGAFVGEWILRGEEGRARPRERW